MKLIEEWKQGWAFLSVQANAIGVALAATYGSMYETLKDTFPPKWMAGITAGIFILGIVARLTKQAELPDIKPKEERHD